MLQIITIILKMVAQPIIHAIAPGKAFEDRKAIAGKRWLDGTVARKNIRTDVMVSLIAGNITGYHRILPTECIWIQWKNSHKAGLLRKEKPS